MLIKELYFFFNLLVFKAQFYPKIFSKNRLPYSNLAYKKKKKKNVLAGVGGIKHCYISVLFSVFLHISNDIHRIGGEGG